jgi:hypothetical protein
MDNQLIKDIMTEKDSIGIMAAIIYSQQPFDALIEEKDSVDTAINILIHVENRMKTRQQSHLENMADKLSKMQHKNGN